MALILDREDTMGILFCDERNNQNLLLTTYFASCSYRFVRVSSIVYLCLSLPLNTTLLAQSR
jgi:hypothetical protein